MRAYHFGEHEDWTFKEAIKTPADAFIVPGDVSTIEVRAIPVGAINQRPIFVATGIVPTDEVSHPYADPDVLSATPRTEGWDRDGTGYNLLYVIERGMIPATLVESTGTRVFLVEFRLLGAANKWGDFDRLVRAVVEGGVE